MSEDTSRIKELQTALRVKMADNKAIADSFRIEDGAVVVSADQKTAFDKNMQDIKEIKGLIEGLETMGGVSSWASEPQDTVAGAFAAAANDVKHLSSREIKSIGEMFLDSAEFKSLNGGRNGANMAAAWQAGVSLTGFNVKDVYSALPSGTMGRGADAVFGSIQRDALVTPPQRTKRVRDLFPVRTTTAAVIEYFRQIGFTSLSAPGVTNSSYSTNNAAAPVAERDGAAFGIKNHNFVQSSTMSSCTVFVFSKIHKSSTVTALAKTCSVF
jgi:hypothetical protein